MKVNNLKKGFTNIKLVKPYKIKKLHFDKAFIFLLPGFIGFFMFYLLPFFYSLGYAFVDKAVNGNFVGFKNFIDLLTNKTYLKALQNSLFFIGVSVPINIILSLGVALLIKKIKKRRDLFLLIFLIPLVIPSGSMVFFWSSFFDYEGYLNGILYRFGINPIEWIESSNVRYVIILIFIWKNIGYNTVLFLAGLHSIPKEYYESASIDGAGSIKSFMYITAFCLIPTLFLVIIMSIINSFKVFKEIYLITGSYPHESIYMLQHFMNNMFTSLNYQKLTTATCVLVLIIVVVTQVLYMIERRVSK